MVGDAVCFGGKYDGRTFDPTADPPFGYREEDVFYHGKKRKVFVQQHINAQYLCVGILLEAVKRVDEYVERE